MNDLPVTRSFASSSVVGRPVRGRSFAFGLLVLGAAACVTAVGCKSSTEDAQASDSELATSNEITAFRFFVGKGLTRVQAAGILGNLVQESNVSPTIRQPDGPGVGIAQWSDGDRWNAAGTDNAVWFANSHGENVWALETQLEFIWYELTTFPQWGLAELRNAGTVAAATIAFMTDFERCGACNASNRIAQANRVLSQGGDVPEIPATATNGEGTQALLTPNQQHFFQVEDGNLNHFWWDAVSNRVAHDVWATGVTGTPVSLVTADQHAFARGTDGSLQHSYWLTSKNQMFHDVWGTGLAGDPAALIIGAYQDVWGVDTTGQLRQWYWGPDTNGFKTLVWEGTVTVAGRPSVFLYQDEQHVFARGTDGSLQHWWWDPKTKRTSHDVWESSNLLAGDPAAMPIGEFQDVWAIDNTGALQQWYWGPGKGIQRVAPWGRGVVGRPSVVTTGAGQQHVFARGTDGSLQHWWWDPKSNAIAHDTWAQAGSIQADPSAELVKDQQHVWATDANGVLQHWFWDPATNEIAHDTWGHP